MGLLDTVAMTVDITGGRVIFATGAAKVYRGWVLSYEARMSGRDARLKVSSGEDLAERPGHLLVRESTGETDGDVFGLLQYLEARQASDDGVAKASEACFSIEVTMHADDLRKLVELELAGRGPKSAHASLHSPGDADGGDQVIAYGFDPSGAALDWDTARCRWVGVTGLSFAFHRELPAPVGGLLAVPAIAPMTDTALTQLVDKRSIWIITLLAAVAAALLLR